MSGWTLRLTARSPLLCGGVGSPPPGLHTATAEVDLSGTVHALLPGSSLKGVLRDAMRRFVLARRGLACTGTDDCPCPTCRLFGTGSRPGTLGVRSATAPMEEHVTWGVGIDRSTRTAARGEPDSGGHLWSERRAFADFAVDIEEIGHVDDADRALVDDLFAWLEVCGLAVGRRKSSGAGAFVLSASRRAPRSAPEAPADLSGEPSVRKRYRLVVTLREPAHLVGPRQRDFYREALDVLPAATLRGALGRAMEERFGRRVAEAVMLGSLPLLVTPGFVLDEAGGGTGPREVPVPWLSLRACSGQPSHLVDVAVDQVVQALGGDGGRPDLCPKCKASLRRRHGGRPKRMVVGQTAIDRDSRTAAEGQLRTVVSVAPGTVFVAETWAHPSHASLLGDLETIRVGGQRSRGYGLAALDVEEVEDSRSIRDRIEATTAAVRACGASVDGRIALLGLLGDAVVAPTAPVTMGSGASPADIVGTGNGPSLAAVLSARRLIPITGEARQTSCGGWDEWRHHRRSLRTALAAGSWVAVRIPDDAALDALEGLLRQPLLDPEEIAPLLLEVREPVETTELPLSSPASPPGDPQLDALVREVRSLCTGGQQLPARSALQTLLRFARGTTSVEELCLFVEYQAARQGKVAAFYRAVAKELRQRYLSQGGSDIAGARRFLGILVRAGTVAAESDRGGEAKSTNQRGNQR